MKKRTIALFTILCLLMSMLYAIPVTAVHAGAYFTVQMAEVTAIKTTLTVDVMIHNNPGISGAVLKLGFDRSVFTLVGADKGTLCAGNDSAFVVWDAAKENVAFAAAETVTGDGALLRLTFRVADTVIGGNYSIKVSAIDLEDGALNDFTAADGVQSVQVRDHLWGDANGDKVTNLADAQTILKWKIHALRDSDLNMTAADADRNGSVGLTDALILLQWLAGYVKWDANGVTTQPLGI